MKEIIVAIDFSKGAINALNYAIVIANSIKANITMIWVDKPESRESIFDNSIHGYRKEVHRRFDEIIKKYGKDLKKGELSFKIRKGKIYEEISNQAKYDDASFIIAGTHGISGFEEFWIGSNANRMVTASPCPVITIRQGYAVKKKINKILLPIDSTIETRQKAPYAAEIAKAFNSEVFILGLLVSSVSTIKKRVENYSKQMVEYFNSIGIKNSYYGVQSTNVTSDSLKFAEENNIDMICIMTEQETSTANILLGPMLNKWLITHLYLF